MTNRFTQAELHLEIAALVKSGKISIHSTRRELAKKHKVSRQRIGKIVNKIRRKLAVECPRISVTMPDIAPTAAKSSALKARIVDETSCRYGDVGEVSAISDAGIFVRFEDGCLGRFAKAACRVRIPAEVT